MRITMETKEKKGPDTGEIHYANSKEWKLIFQKNVLNFKIVQVRVDIFKTTRIVAFS